MSAFRQCSQAPSVSAVGLAGDRLAAYGRARHRRRYEVALKSWTLLCWERVKISPADQLKFLICREFLESTSRPRFLKTCRKKPRGVALRRAYRRCVRNVSACSAHRQQQSADLQAL